MTLEGKFDAAKKEAEKREEDKKELETELERMKSELEKLRRDKDQDIKNFEELQQTLEQTEINMGEHHPGLKVLTRNTSTTISWILILSSLNHLYHIEPDLTPNIHSLATSRTCWLSINTVLFFDYSRNIMSCISTAVLILKSKSLGRT